MTYKLGITGGIASGKSSAAAEFAAAGYPVIDADMIAKELLQAGSELLKKVQTTFGPMTVQGNGALNRGALAAIVFADDAKRQQLNAIMQPAIRREFEQQLAAAVAKQPDIVVGDVPLLFEQNYADLFDGVVAMDIDDELQRERLMTRDGLTRVQADKRIASQLPTAEKLARADFAIDTRGPEALRDVQVQQLIAHIRQL